MCLSFFARREFLQCGAGLAQLGREFIQVPPRLILSVEERFEEVCLRGRHGFRTHGHGHVFLERFVFLKSVLDGLAVDRLGSVDPGIFERRQASPLLDVRVLELQLPWPRGRHCPLFLMRLAR